jgi:hypothetical protein
LFRVCFRAVQSCTSHGVPGPLLSRISMEISSSLPVRPTKSVPPCRKAGNGLEAVFKLKHYHFSALIASKVHRA